MFATLWHNLIEDIGSAKMKSTDFLTTGNASTV